VWISCVCLVCYCTICDNNSSFQKTEGLHLVDKPQLKTISFDSMNSVKKLGMRLEATAVLLVSFVCCINSKHTTTSNLIIKCICCVMHYALSMGQITNEPPSQGVLPVSNFDDSKLTDCADYS